MAKPTGFGGRDYPDFGVSVLNTAAASITDLSELAVRMGSINRFDRSGVVLYQDAFEYGRGNWFDNSYPAGAFATLNGEFFSTIPYSLRLQTTTDAGSYSGVSCALPFPFLAPVGIELHFKGYTSFKWLFIKFAVHDGTLIHTIECRIYGDDDEIHIIAKTDGDTIVSTDTLWFGANTSFHVIKIVADLLTGYFSRLIIDQMDYNMSSLDIPTSSPGAYPQMNGLIQLYSVSGDVETVLIDNIIITYNEPT